MTLLTQNVLHRFTYDVPFQLTLHLNEINMLWPLCLQLPHPLLLHTLGTASLLSAHLTMLAYYWVPKATFFPWGRLCALSTFLSDDRLKFLSSAPLQISLSCGRIKQPRFRSVNSTTGRAASPADMYRYKGDERRAGDRRSDWRTQSNKWGYKGIKHISSCKSDAQLPPLVVWGFFSEQNCRSLDC